MSFELTAPAVLDDTGLESLLEQAALRDRDRPTLILELGAVTEITVASMIGVILLGQALEQGGQKMLLHTPLAPAPVRWLEALRFFEPAAFCFTVYPPYRKGGPAAAIAPLLPLTVLGHASDLTALLDRVEVQMGLPQRRRAVARPDLKPILEGLSELLALGLTQYGPTGLVGLAPTPAGIEIAAGFYRAAPAANTGLEALLDRIRAGERLTAPRQWIRDRGGALQLWAGHERLGLAAADETVYQNGQALMPGSLFRWCLPAECPELEQC